MSGNNFLSCSKSIVQILQIYIIVFVGLFCSLFISLRIALGFKTTTFESQRGESVAVLARYRTLRKESNLFSLSEEPIVLLRMDGNSGRRYWMHLRIFLRAFAAEGSSIKMYSLNTRTRTSTLLQYILLQYIKQLLPYIFMNINLYKSIFIKQ